MEAERKRIIVTGASGFLGSRIASFYGGRYEVHAPSHEEMDITEEESVKRAFAGIRPDIVIHCAAVSDVGACERDPERSWRINVEGSRNMAKASAVYGAKCLIASSDQVYFGSGGTEPHREDEELQPGNVYGREKRRAEELCLEADPDCVLLRLSWMYDAERKSVPGRQHGDFFTALASVLATSGKLEYSVCDRRGITDVNEVVRNLEKAFALKGGIYNFGSPNDRNTYETVCALFRALSWDTARVAKNEGSCGTEPRNLTMDLRKIQENGIFFQSTVQALSRNAQLLFQGERY